MVLNKKALGLTAFITYFGLDALTTCIGVHLFGMNAEVNPAMLATLGAFGLVGFMSLKLALSLGLTLPSYVLSTHQETSSIGISALIAIIAGGIIVSINNAGVLLTGVSIFYVLFGSISFIGPGILIGLLMLTAGFIAYVSINAHISLKRRPGRVH
jgi:hypothetical protein